MGGWQNYASGAVGSSVTMEGAYDFSTGLMGTHDHAYVGPSGTISIPYLSLTYPAGAGGLSF
jgi:hypothetical protein